MTILLVGALAGSAVAFAVGGGLSPHNTVCIHPIAGSSYQICVQVPPQNLRNIKITGISLGKLGKGHLHLSFTNHNKVPIKIHLLLVIETKHGKVIHFTRTFVINPGKTFTLNRTLHGIHVRGARLTLTISDSTGDHAKITRTVGHFRH